jgi:hypothetical protein
MKNIFYFLFIVFMIISCKKESSNDDTDQTGVPSVTTTGVAEIKGTSASVTTEITNSGGLSILERGVCYSSSKSNPTIEDLHTSDGTSKEQLVSTINDLTPVTLYYVRAYATNKNGTGYGSTLQFTTTNILITGTYTHTQYSTMFAEVNNDNLTLKYYEYDPQSVKVWFTTGVYEYRGKLISNPSTNFTVQGNWYNYLRTTGYNKKYLVVQQKDANTIVYRGSDIGYEDAYLNGSSSSYILQ